MKTNDDKLISKYHFGLTEKMHEDAMMKAGIISLAAIIRELLRKWLDGEVEVDYTKLTK